MNDCIMYGDSSSGSSMLYIAGRTGRLDWRGQISEDDPTGGYARMARPMRSPDTKKMKH
jgi:hypothetical protein